MAGDNDVYAEGRWIDLQRLEVVKQEEPMQPASILGKPAVSSNRHSKKRQEGMRQQPARWRLFVERPNTSS
jgi:hypothetical protein